MSIVKLIKGLKKPLVICNIEGGYGTEPRWGRGVRKGKMKASIKHVYPFDEIKSMDNDELYKLVIDSITVDDYHFYESYKSKYRAEYLERVLYICPICKKMHTIYSKENKVYCKECGLEVEYLENLSLVGNKKDFSFQNVSDWYNFQIEFVKQIESFNEDVIYCDQVKAFSPQMYHSKIKLGTGTLKMYQDRFELDLDKMNEVLYFNEIDAVTILGKKKMNIYVGDNTYQVFYDDKTNFLKYLHLFYIIKNKGVESNDEFLGL